MKKIIKKFLFIIMKANYLTKELLEDFFNISLLYKIISP